MKHKSVGSGRAGELGY